MGHMDPLRVSVERFFIVSILKSLNQRRKKGGTVFPVLMEYVLYENLDGDRYQGGPDPEYD